MTMPKKKIVYLLGAGATHAVIKDATSGRGLLTDDIQDLIQNKYSGEGVDREIWNEIVTQGHDVEHLISVLESHHNYSTSQKVRRYYRSALVELAKAFSQSPPRMNLYTVLFDLHSSVPDLPEELLCFITLNYEDILEQCLKKHFDCHVDYIVKTSHRTTTVTGVPVLKLHGSFNWVNGIPIGIKAMTAVTDRETLWIPPGIEKRRENYPFNLLWGKATEFLMECDVLRVIGCSLSRNDWGLIPILYTAQRFNRLGKNMRVEIIDFSDTGERIRQNYRYLKIAKITEIEEVISFHQRLFPRATRLELEEEMEVRLAGASGTNPFQTWLDAKIDCLVYDGKSIATKRHFVYDFYNKV